MRTAAIVCLLAVTCLAAAPDPAARDRAHGYLMRRVTDTLGLSDDAARRMRDVLERADARRQELTSRRDSLEASLRTAVATSPVDARALGRLVADAHGVQVELAALPAKTFDEARAILTVEQQARLLLLRRDLQGEVRQAIRRRSAASTPAHAR